MLNGLLGDLSSRALGTGEGERMSCLFAMSQRPEEPRACESHRWTPRGRSGCQSSPNIYVLPLLAINYTLDVPVGSITPCTTATGVPAGAGRVPARVRARASP